jgi:undecaprenyl-diphosphatase
VTTLESVALGALQGLAEFLPISSSGHLLLVRQLMGLGEVPVLYDVLLHVSTVLVVLVVFRRRIGAILAALWRGLFRRPRAATVAADQENRRLALWVVAATAMTAAVGLPLSRLEERVLAEPRLLSLFFLVTALILLATVFFRGERGYAEIGLVGALLIGLAQGIGVLPGISRSGITIAAALLWGLQREKAGEFSFLLVVPAVLGALLLQLRDAGALLAQVDAVRVGIGFLVSFAVGLFSLLLLLRVVRRGRLPYFAIYLLPLSVAAFFVLR